MAVTSGADAQVNPYPELKFKAVTELIVVVVGPVPLFVKWYPFPVKSFHCVTLLPLTVYAPATLASYRASKFVVVYVDVALLGFTTVM